MTEHQKPNMIYSPLHHIPLFEVVITQTGAKAIRIKRNQVYEVVTLDDLLDLVINAAKATQR